jgi:hypothetical protein
LALALAQPVMAAPANRIVAVGDLHGDFAAWRDIAHAARLVDSSGRWIGGNSVLVQTGDVVDRGPDSLKILDDLMRLQKQASDQGGQVVALVGNHEAMNMTGDLRYVSAGDYAAFADRNSRRRLEDFYAANKPGIVAAYRQRDPSISEDAIHQAWINANPPGSIERAIAWRPDGRIGRWILANPAVALIDGNLFLHAGISPAYVHMPISEINRQVRLALMAQTTDPKAIINDPLGPLWYRGLAMTDGGVTGAPASAVADTAAEPPVEDQLTQILTAFGAKRIVIGHTPVLTGIAIQYGGRLIQIDTGITSAYGGKVSYLELLGGVPTPHVVERSPSPGKENAQ